MRTSSLSACMILAGCNGPAGDPAGTTGEMVDCALEGQADFARVCAVERHAAGSGTALTISGPDGGFRRLLITRDGRGVVAADGADPAQVIPLGDTLIEVRLDGDRFRLPATIGAGQRKEP